MKTKWIADNSSNAVTALSDAGGLFDVEYVPASFERESISINHVEIVTPRYEKGKRKGTPLHQWAVRTDTGAPLGLHSGKYPLEHSSYRMMAELAESTFPNSTIEVQLWANGEKVALIQDIGCEFEISNGDVVRPNVVWVSSFNGHWATAVHSLSERLFCSNQLPGTALFKVKHTRNHNLRFKEKVQIVNAAREQAEIVARMAQVLADQAFTDVEFKELVANLVPLPQKNIETGEYNTHSLNTVERKRDKMYEYWENEVVTWGSRTSRGVIGNRWLAFNAVQGAEQHVFNAKGETQEEKMLSSLERTIDKRTIYANKALEALAHG